MYLTSISINELVIKDYLVNYSVKIVEQIDPNLNFTAISGKQVQGYLGDKREITVTFEPMETSQINQLFRAIKNARENIPIQYIDPQLGETVKYFTCSNLPAATWFRDDYTGKQYWTVPDIVFVENEVSLEYG